MADVRALLAAERQARRISHPFLTYAKSGQLLCNVCNLNVKSEALWEGHLRSANHRKSVSRVAEEKSTKTLKRKLDDVDESDEDVSLLEDDARKKSKSRAVSHAEDINGINGQAASVDKVPPVQKTVRFNVQEPPIEEPNIAALDVPTEEILAKEQQSENDDGEMAAFEKEIASLEGQPDYSAATISAAPVSAAELEQLQKEDKRRQQEVEAEDEIDEESRKMEEEFEAMEELEDRINKLKERREALRSGGRESSAAEQFSPTKALAVDELERVPTEESDDDDDDDDDDDIDDWYR